LKTYDKPDVYLSYLTRPSAIFLARGERAPQKLSFFVITEFISCHKKPIFHLLVYPYRGAWGMLWKNKYDKYAL